MPSTTISIRSGNYSCTSSYGVDPNMPAILRGGRVHEIEWRTFCDEINEKLEPLNRLQRTHHCHGLLFYRFRSRHDHISLTFTSSMNNSDPYNSDGPKSQMLYFLSFRFWWCLAWLGYRRVSKKIQGAYDGIHDVCVEASKKQSLVSYHFRNDVVTGGYSSTTSSQTTYRNVYIEVSISDQPVCQQSSNATGYPPSLLLPHLLLLFPTTQREKHLKCDWKNSITWNICCRRRSMKTIERGFWRQCKEVAGSQNHLHAMYLCWHS